MEKIRDTTEKGRPRMRWKRSGTQQRKEDLTWDGRDQGHNRERKTSHEMEEIRDTTEKGRPRMRWKRSGTQQRKEDLTWDGRDQGHNRERKISHEMEEIRDTTNLTVEYLREAVRDR